MSDDIFSWDDTPTENTTPEPVTTAEPVQESVPTEPKYPNPITENEFGSPNTENVDDLDLPDYTSDADVASPGVEKLTDAGVDNDTVADVLEEKKRDREDKKTEPTYTKRDILAIFKIYEHLITSPDDFKKIFAGFMGKMSMNDLDLAISVSTGDNDDLQQSLDIAKLVIDACNMYDANNGHELSIKDGFALASRIETFSRKDLQRMARGLNRLAKELSTEGQPIGGMSAAKNLDTMDVTSSFLETMKGVVASNRHRDFFNWLDTTISRLG